ncbi:DUF418 domain-containing protein [Frigoribacterium salinisoli]
MTTAGPLGRPRGAQRPPAGDRRLVAVDVARGLAVLGMFAAHLWPRDVLDERLFDGRSAILFATLAGASLGLLTGGARPPSRGRWPRLYGSIALRAALLVLLGLALQAWNEFVLVILPYYGVMFLLLLPLLRAPRAVVAVVGAVLLVGAPWAASLVPVDARGDAVAAGGVGLAQDALLVGAYPALVWLPFLCAGLLAARSDLRRGRTRLVLVVGGVLAAVVGYGARSLPGAADVAALDPAAHGGAPAEVLGSGGVAVAVLGVLLGLLDGSPGRSRRVLRTTLHPLAATGAQPLTVYAAHLLLTAPLFVLHRLAGGAYGLPIGWLVASVVLTLLAATLWQRWLGRGPLERVVGRLSRPWSWGGGPDAPGPDGGAHGGHGPGPVVAAPSVRG